jgi:L-asparagine transporter-like permease
MLLMLEMKRILAKNTIDCAKLIDVCVQHAEPVNNQWTKRKRDFSALSPSFSFALSIDFGLLVLICVCVRVHSSLSIAVCSIILLVVGIVYFTSKENEKK